MSQTLDSTIALVESTGWRIFPSLGKTPKIRNWPNECSRDPDVIRGWWRQWPDAVPSLVTGPRNGIIVLDIDVGTDKNGQPYNGWESLEAAFHCTTTPITPHVITRRGGSHLYFACDKLPDSDILNDRHPAHRAAIKNSVSQFAAHVDVRGWNGQVVLPAEGTGYTLDPALDFSIPMLPAQAWFNHRQKRAFKPHQTHQRFDRDRILEDACHEIASAPEGTRHDTYRHVTFKIARLVGLGLIDRTTARHALQGTVIALGMIADGHTRRVDKYFARAWEEGLIAAHGGRYR